jgi:hypothetical protein
MVKTMVSGVDFPSNQSNDWGIAGVRSQEAHMQPPALSQEMSHLPVHRTDGRRGAGPFPELGEKKPERFLELIN